MHDSTIRTTKAIVCRYFIVLALILQPLWPSTAGLQPNAVQQEGAPLGVSGADSIGITLRIGLKARIQCSQSHITGFSLCLSCCTILAPQQHPPPPACFIRCITCQQCICHPCCQLLMLAITHSCLLLPPAACSHSLLLAVLQAADRLLPCAVYPPAAPLGSVTAACCPASCRSTPSKCYLSLTT
jgi:hypothetical protein